MKNSSEIFESFTLSPFSDESLPVRVHRENFISIFDTPPVQEEVYEESIDVEAIARKAFEDAFIQGEKAGYEMGMKRVEPLLKRLNHYISELAGFREELVARSEQMSINLALTFAEAIILKECEEKRAIVAEMVKKALEICEEKNDITIRVRREDTEYISSDGHGYTKVVADDTVGEPGFVIETSFGDIDGRISTQIEELKKKVLG
ncbi:MAG: hypothetical protein C0392_01830 [Syntrophus sp. (in: bacteria)]|nr:hypothetical protein [Syntrophus sp. (in: bacteria)]